MSMDEAEIFADQEADYDVIAADDLAENLHHQNDNNSDAGEVKDDEYDLDDQLFDNIDEIINQKDDDDDDEAEQDDNDSIDTSRKHSSNNNNARNSHSQDQQQSSSRSSNKKRKESSNNNLNSQESSSKTTTAHQRKLQLQKKKEEEIKLAQERVTEQVNEVKKLMHKYHRKDMNSIKDSKPALAKVKHVDEVLQMLNKQKVQREFIDNKGLDFLTQWLDKFQNGPEPSVSLRKKLLNFIYELPVQRHHFNGIQLGKVIYRIAEKSEVKELKSLALRVVEKWSKILNTQSRNHEMDDLDEVDQL